MSFGGLILTNQGRNKIAAAISNEKALDFTHVQLGDGTYNGSYTGKKELTNMIMEIPVTRVVRRDNEVTIDCDWNSSQAPAGFYFREIGIIGNGVLCYYDNAGTGDAEYIDPDSEMVSKEKRIRLTVVVSDDVNVTVHTASNLYALSEEVEEKLQTLDEKKVNESDVYEWARQSEKPSYSKIEVGLGNVDNTADKDKPVSTDMQAALDLFYANANQFTLNKIAELVNGAPATMDTLKEIADAMATHQTVVAALDAAIGQKANQAELDTHTNNSTIHLTASDRQQFFRGNAEWGWRNPEWTEDIDGWVLPGCYGVSDTCTHLPPNIAKPWGNLLVFPSMEGRILQIYYDWNDPDKVYHRVINGTTASNWMLFADDMYGICTTDANESTMEISSDLSYARRHQKMTIYFVNGCNAGTKYLKINGQTAIRMYCQGGDLSHNIPRGSFVEVIFIDGAAYLIESKSNDANTLLNVDTRHSNSDPNWYQGTYPRRTVTEIKNCASIGLDSSVAGGYCTLETSLPWSDNSGGYATQIAKTNSGAVFTRTGTSGSTWGSWKKICTNDMLGGAVSIGISKPLSNATGLSQLFLGAVIKNSNQAIFDHQDFSVKLLKTGSYMISGQVRVETTGNTGNVKRVRIMEIGSNSPRSLAETSARGIGSASGIYQTLVISPKVVDLTAGNLVAMYFQDESNSFTIVANAVLTYMTVVKIPG